MTNFDSFTMVREPLEVVWTTLRDDLSRVARQLEDLESIDTVEREVSETGVWLLNRWTARQKVPALLARYLGTDRIAWEDRAFWRDASKCCEWSIRPTLLPEHVECSGVTRYEPVMAGRGTRVSFRGSFTLKPGFGGALPAALEPTIASFAESIISTLIPRNLARAVQVAGQTIAAERAPRGELAGPVESAPHQPLQRE
ncbi:MAG TPA: hypothetical protein VFQ35_14840 [Polyangiaceae bacterium]|nr:hypothetical protein [Polyangiaceae bacterium]